MSTIKPFKAIRPSEAVASKVASLPYDVLTSDEARKVAAGNPYSFLHIDKSEIDLDENLNPYDKSVYEKAKTNLDNMIKNKILICDEKPCLYIYMLTMNGKSQTGIAACTSVDEYLNGTIKKHELTREEKEIDRINHIDKCDANVSPIFMAYNGKKSINDILENWKNKFKPVYDFTASDGIGHKVWVIDDDNTITSLVNEFKNVPNIYIADGHHRNASTVKVALKRRNEHKDYTGNEEFNFYLSVMFPKEELNILSYNRVVKDLNGFTYDEFINKLSFKFYIEKLDSELYSPENKHDFGFYTNGIWHKLTAKPEILNADTILDLDVSILQNNVLNPILGIKDIKTDKRIDFVGGIKGTEELKKQVDCGEMAAAFSMYPTSMKELMDIADAGEIMPPKSTWFEPKLRSGLLIHSLK